MRHFFKSFLTILSKILFALFVPWFGFLIFVLFFDGYHLVILIFLLISIALFMALLGYAIHSKQLKNYLKSIAWIIGTPIALIVTYVIIAIVTHDPIVPRPLTVHQLLTGYNIVYTHDGKLYQNDEYVMDLEEIFGEYIGGSEKCDTCIHSRLDVYGFLYINSFGGFQYEINMSDDKVKKTEKIPFFLGYQVKPYYRDQYHPTWDYPTWVGRPILSNNLGYLIKEKVKYGKYINNHYYQDQYQYTRLTVDNNGSITDTIEMKEEILRNNIVQKYLTGYEIDKPIKLNIIGIVNQNPVIKISQYPTEYILKGVDVLMQNYDFIEIYDNNIYSLGRLSHIDNYGHYMKKVYKDGEEFGLSPTNWYVDSFFGVNLIQDSFCPNTSYDLNYDLFCNMNGKLRSNPILDLLTMNANILPHIRSVLWWGSNPNMSKGAVIQQGSVSTIASEANLEEDKNKLLTYHNIISNIIRYLYHIRGSFDIFGEILDSRNLYRILSNYYFPTDIIFLRPFHDSGREYSETIPLISGIDNFFGIYPVTPPENTDPNADINVGQLIMDTYFPKETEEVDPAAILIERLRQREERLHGMSGNSMSQREQYPADGCFGVGIGSGTIISNYPISIVSDLGKLCADALSDDGIAGTIALYKDDVRISHVSGEYPQSGILIGEKTTEYPMRLTGTIRRLLYHYTGDVDLIFTLNNHCISGEECSAPSRKIKIPIEIEGVNRGHMDKIYKQILAKNGVEFLYSKTLDLLPLYGMDHQGHNILNYSMPLGMQLATIKDYETCLKLSMIRETKNLDCSTSTIMVEFGFIDRGNIGFKIYLSENDRIMIDRTYSLSKFNF